MATRRCKRGKLKNPVRTRTGGKRICKKKSGRKSKRTSRRKSKRTSRRRTSRRRRSFKLESSLPKENLFAAKENIMDLAKYVQNNFKKADQDPEQMIPDTLIQIYLVLVPGVIPEYEEKEVLAIGEKIRENTKKGVKTNEKDIRRMMKILVKTRSLVVRMS